MIIELKDVDQHELKRLAQALFERLVEKMVDITNEQYAEAFQMALRDCDVNARVVAVEHGVYVEKLES